MTITLEEARSLTIGEMSGLSARELMQLQTAAAESLRHAQDLSDWIHGAVALKYDAQTQELRSRLGKETGIVHFDDDGVLVTAELPKKPVWDQKKLSVIAGRIAAAGDDPAEFLEITYKCVFRRR
jgi:hypothetical protein